MRTTSRRTLAAIAAALVAVGLASPSAAVAAPHPAKPASGHAALTARHGHAPKRAGQGLAAPRLANLRQLVRAAHAKRSAAADRAMAPRSHLATPSGANVTSQFDGITQATPGIGYDTEAVSATNGNQILEIAGNFVQVTDNNGAVQCGGGITVAHLLRSSGIFIQPQVMYDNFQGHFIMTTVPVNFLSSALPPEMWVAVSASTDPCGAWTVYDLTFSGGPFALRATLTPRIGQDRTAVLVEADVLDPGLPSVHTVFAIAKSDLYQGNHVSFPAFTVGTRAVPVSNAGQPMIDSPAGYFLGADPQIGYELYSMPGSDQAVSLVTTISNTYSPPTQAIQPPNDPGPATDGRISSSPVYDGSRIWFTHGVQGRDFATVRYGYLDLGANTVRHAQITVNSPFSYEFNGSLGVGLNADGTEAIFLSWDYTVPRSGIQVSDAVDAFVWNGGALGWPPDTQGQEHTLVTGSTSGEVGAYSSVAVEPATFGVTTCAVTTQMYRDSGAWKTRLARVCSPTTVNVPDLTGRTVDQAAAILAPYDLSVGVQTATTNCDPVVADGLVMGSTPAHNQPAPLGSAVGVTLCRRIVPNVLGETVSNASSDIQAAGLQVGAISSTSDCDQSAAGTVTVTVPPSGTALPYQSFVGLTWCAPLPPPPPSGIVPPLIGFTRDQAAQQLNAAGFVLGTVRTVIDNSCEFIGTVMSQSPAGGSHASRGSSVSITIGRAPRTCGL